MDPGGVKKKRERDKFVRECAPCVCDAREFVAAEAVTSSQVIVTKDCVNKSHATINTRAHTHAQEKQRKRKTNAIDRWLSLSLILPSSVCLGDIMVVAETNAIVSRPLLIPIH